MEFCLGECLGFLKKVKSWRRNELGYKMNKFLISTIVLIFICGCGRPVETISPIKSAYNDGFEVIVIKDGNVAEAKIFKLGEAEKLISNKSTFTLSVPTENLQKLNKIIEASNKKSQNSSCPIVNINVTKDNNSEIIDLSYHYGKSTFHYCYETDNKKIIPLWSSYRDLNKNNKTIYKSQENSTDHQKGGGE